MTPEAIERAIYDETTADDLVAFLEAGVRELPHGRYDLEVGPQQVITYSRIQYPTFDLCEVAKVDAEQLLMRLDLTATHASWPIPTRFHKAIGAGYRWVAIHAYRPQVFAEFLQRDMKRVALEHVAWTVKQLT